MGILGEVFEWLTSAESWSGAPYASGIPTRLVEHVWMSAISVGIASVLALPVALMVGHTRRFRFFAVTTANLGRAVPSFAILGISFAFVRFGSIGFWATIIALVALAIPPILTNTYVGIQEVDPDTVEAARGVGLSERDILLRVEAPLALPLIITGLRVATVQVIATATLAALAGWGGLGRFIIDGFAVRDFGRIGGGALLVALLAILTEALFSMIERMVMPGSSWLSRRLDSPLDAMVQPITPAGGGI